MPRRETLVRAFGSDSHLKALMLLYSEHEGENASFQDFITKALTRKDPQNSYIKKLECAKKDLSETYGFLQLKKTSEIEYMLITEAGRKKTQSLIQDLINSGDYHLVELDFVNTKSYEKEYCSALFGFSTNQ